jgi:hypothetical protein
LRLKATGYVRMYNAFENVDAKSVHYYYYYYYYYYLVYLYVHYTTFVMESFALLRLLPIIC